MVATRHILGGTMSGPDMVQGTEQVGRARQQSSTELLQIALLDQTLHVSLTDVELTVLGQVDSAGKV